MSNDFLAKIKEFKPKLHEPLAAYTTWKIGGPAEYFIQANNAYVLKEAAAVAFREQVPVTVIGWGSNVLISDKGIKGLVIRNVSRNIKINGDCNADIPVAKSAARLEQVDTSKYYSFSDLDYDESGSDRVSVTIDSGVNLPYLINHLISEGVTGLQWFSGIPGTLGGAVYNNIHGGSHFMEEYVLSAEVINTEGEVKRISHKEMDFDYDYSRYHNSGEIILSVELCLYKGDMEKARKASVLWATKKKLQPHNTAGCCFQNILPAEQKRLKLESNSWGFIIDQLLGLKGTRIGGAEISTEHAAFIENKGGATAADVLELFKLIYASSKQKLGIEPKPEIIFLGFGKDEIEPFF